MKKTLIFAIIAANLIGCAARAPKPIPNNPAFLKVSEEKPVGYPKTSYIRVPNTTVCEELTQDWRQDTYNGHKVWFRDEMRKTVNCPAGV